MGIFLKESLIKSKKCLYDLIRFSLECLDKDIRIMGLKRSLLLPLLGLLIFLAWLVFYSNDRVTGSNNLHMATLAEMPVGGDFKVNSSDGELALSDFKGSVVLLYFGYATCPDICPASLSKISLALQNLSQKERSHVKTLFISLDPEHDTVESLKDYAHYYHGSIIGAVASKPELDKMAKQYGVTYGKVESDTALGYRIDHTAYFYIIGSNGKLKSALPHGTTVSELSKLLQETLSGN